MQHGDSEPCIATSEMRFHLDEGDSIYLLALGSDRFQFKFTLSRNPHKVSLLRDTLLLDEEGDALMADQDPVLNRQDTEIVEQPPPQAAPSSAGVVSDDTAITGPARYRGPRYVQPHATITQLISPPKLGLQRNWSNLLQNFAGALWIWAKQSST